MTAILTYVIRDMLTGKLADVPNCHGACHEGADGKKRAQDLIDSHNKFASSGVWYLSEEYI